MNRKKTIKTIILGGLFLLLSHVPTLAGFGVSPTNVLNEYLKPGFTFEREIFISRSVDLAEAEINIASELPGFESWFSFLPGKTFKFANGSSTTSFKILINVPEDAEYKRYDGVIRVTAKSAQQEVGGVSIINGARLEVNLATTEEEFKLLTIKSIKVRNSLVGEDIKIDIIGENSGNVAVSPRMEVTIMDLLMEDLETHEIQNFGSIEPNETKDLTGEFKTNLETGEYFILVKVFLDEELLRQDRLVFNINNVPQEDNDSDPGLRFDAFLSGGISLVKRTILYILIFEILFLLVYLLLQKILKDKSIEKLKKKLGNKPFVTKKIISVTSSVLFSTFAILILVLFLPSLSLEKEVKVEEDGETQGVQTHIPLEDIEVSGPPIPSELISRYFVYSEPSISSEILYEAKEGESFDIEEEMEDWYRIRLENKTFGWIAKYNIKSITQVEQ
jgi:hypothetical protein